MKALYVAALAVVVTLLLLVWPGVWRYDTVTVPGLAGQQHIRTHRLSGEAQRLSRRGWVGMNHPSLRTVPAREGCGARLSPEMRRIVCS
jgi:hypothetical protein